MLNDKQNQIIVGSLLGDGCIEKNEDRFRFVLSQSKLDHFGKDKRSYLYFYEKEFEDFGTNVSESTVRASGVVIECGLRDHYDRYVFGVKSLPFWKKLESKWYKTRIDHDFFKRTKIIPNDIQLSPLTLTIWHMEDGTNNQIDANIELNTQCFSRDEIQFLIDKLKLDLSINAKEKKDRGKYKIFIGRSSYFDFIDMIKPNIEWDCFSYKFDTSKYNKKPHKGENHSMSKLTEKQVDDIFYLSEAGWLQKDLASKFKVSKPTVSMILSGDRWGS